MHLKEKMRAGGKTAGTMARIVRNPALMALAKNAGLDFVMFDCEHGFYDIETLHDAFLLGRAMGVPGFVRVPVGTKDYISRVLDAGAVGVMVPMVETAGYAEELVKYAKYPPVGGRGFSAGGAHTCYAGGSHTQIMAEHNGQIIAIAQIETKLAVDNIDAIAAVEGLDALLIGPNDLSISLGIPGDLLNPIELEAIARVAAACRKHGKIFGMHAGAALLKKFAADIRLCMSLSDSDLLIAGMKGIRETVDSL
ncbi:MAG: aldolase/citrate lyase family protein [Oscillospiraceae bacterium]|nr:aldolase/citrate lyase family protein [Oscillospiraceae bacterium]